MADVTVYMNNTELVFTGNRQSLNGGGPTIWGDSEFYSPQCGGVLEAGSDFKGDMVTLFVTGTRFEINLIGQNEGSPTDGGRLQINGTTVRNITTYSGTPLDQCLRLTAVMDKLPKATHQVTYIQDTGIGYLHSFVYTPYTVPPTPSPKPYKDEVLNVGPIVAIAVGGAAALVAMCITAWICYRKRSKRRASADQTGPIPQFNHLEFKQTYPRNEFTQFDSK